MKKITNKKQCLMLFLLSIVLLSSASYAFWKYSADAACVRISVKLSLGNTPIVNVLIEGEKYPLNLQLGSSGFSCLDADVLGKIQKSRSNKVNWRDLEDNVYETLSYRIPQIRIGSFAWKNVLVYDTSPQNKDACNIWGKDPAANEYLGTIGNPLLENTNLCLDLYHRAIYICNNLKILQNKKICPKNMIRIPFHLERNFMTVQAETDLGAVNLIFSTNFTFSVLKDRLVTELTPQQDRDGRSFITTTRFMLSGVDFGELDMHLHELGPKSEGIDGALGMNFLDTHIVYIDYPNRCIYVGDCHF